MTIFDDGVHLERSDDGRLKGRAHERWRVFKGPNGGYLAAVMMNAHLVGLNDPAWHPRTFGVHFIARALEGDIELEFSVDRIGRSAASTSVRLFQDDKLCATSYCAFGPEPQGGSYDEVGMPEVAKPEDIPDMPVPPEMLPPFAANFRYRMALGNLPYTASDRAELGGWIDLIEPRPIDPVYLTALADSFPPSIFARMTRPIDVPTVDLTVHFFGAFPLEPDWVLCRFDSPVAVDGALTEDGWMWGRDGQLLARSRQYALYRE